MGTTLMNGLFDEHKRELFQASAIDPDVAYERRYETIGRPSNADPYTNRNRLKKLGTPTWAIGEDYLFPGLLIPMYRATGELISHQFKPRIPASNRDGKKMKYASMRGRATVIDVHPRWSKDRGEEDAALVPYIRDIATPLYITEGIKKADSMTSRGMCTVALTGVYNWRNSLGSLGDWEDIPLRGREVCVVFDADAVTNPMVLTSMRRIGRWLKSKGATVHYLIPPATHNGQETKGVDDWFAAGGDLVDLRQCISNVPPLPERAVQADPYTDAAMVDRIVEDALDGNYLYTAELGWLRYTGRRYERCDAGDITEIIRQHVIMEYLKTLDRKKAAVQASDQRALDQANFDEDGWHRYQSKSKLEAIERLARDNIIVKRDVRAFDSDPDVLNTPAGVLNLETLALSPHNPDHYFTKITTVSYDKNAASPAWDAILTCIPEGVHEFLRRRLAQAITGHTPDDDAMTMLTGGGSNGKTLLMETIVSSLGDVDQGSGYAQMIASELLLSNKNKGAATPEVMDLRGARLAYMEETPEDRYLSVNTLKQIIGTRTLKGRHLYKDMATFRASHTLFLNTNFPPKVVETDDGSWRRLVRIQFPYRFRAMGPDGQANDDKGPWLADDRPADGTVAGMVDRQDRTLLAAALRWLVEAVPAWYAPDGGLKSAFVPEPVREALRTWRAESDYIYGFIQARMVPDAEAWVSNDDFYAEMVEWMETQKAGAKGSMPSLATVVQRLKGHSGLGITLRHTRKRGNAPNRSMRPAQGSWMSGASPSSEIHPDAQATSIVGLRFAPR